MISYYFIFYLIFQSHCDLMKLEGVSARDAPNHQQVIRLFEIIFWICRLFFFIVDPFGMSAQKHSTPPQHVLPCVSVHVTNKNNPWEYVKGFSFKTNACKWMDIVSEQIGGITDPRCSALQQLGLFCLFCLQLVINRAVFPELGKPEGSFGSSSFP